MGENSLRALASDLAYLEAWVLAATGTPLPWPAPEALAVKISASLSRRSIGRIAAKASSSTARFVTGSRERAGERSVIVRPYPWGAGASLVRFVGLPQSDTIAPWASTVTNQAAGERRGAPRPDRLCRAPRDAAAGGACSPC